jgi:hypothetical protein
MPSSFGEHPGLKHRSVHEEDGKEKHLVLRKLGIIAVLSLIVTALAAVPAQSPGSAEPIG